MSQDEPKVPETAELTRQQIVEMLQGVVREIDVHRNKIRGQLRSVSDKIPLLKELQELDRIRKPLKNCITGAGGSVTPEAPQLTQPIDPLAIGRFVSQACQAFELLKGFHERSITLTGPTFSSSGLSSEGTLTRSLIMHFVFLIARLYRLCSARGDALPERIPQDAVKKFFAGVAPIVRIRHLNEHGHDPDRWSNFKAKMAKYSLPFLGEINLEYNEELFRWDRTGAWMGDVLLQPIYEATKEFEKVAGYPAMLIGLRLNNEAEQSSPAAPSGPGNAAESAH